MSMGGYGAYKWGLTCPEKFAAIGGVAGSYHAEYRYQGKVNTVSTLCEALYGDPPAITPEVHDVFTLLKKPERRRKRYSKIVYLLWYRGQTTSGFGRSEGVCGSAGRSAVV